MAYFNRSKKLLRPIVGNGVTNSAQLDEVGQWLFPGKFSGVYTQDKDYSTDKPYAIYNLDVSGQPGSHWISTVIEHAPFTGSSNDTPHKHGGSSADNKPKLLVFDSFGRPSDQIVPILNDKFKIEDTDYDTEQKRTEENCGLNSLCFLVVYDQLGREYARMI